MNSDKDSNSKALAPQPEDKKSSSWELEDDDIFMLEPLLARVRSDIEQGREIADILRRKPLSKFSLTNRQQLMTEDEYQEYRLNFYRTNTSKGHKPVIGVRNLRSRISDAIYYIVRSPEDFPGQPLRMVSVVETAMIHLGLHILDTLLVRRSKIVESRKEAIRLGRKEKLRRLEPSPYKFFVLVDTEPEQHNLYCLSPEDYARLVAIAEDYGWTLTFTTQFILILAIAASQKLPDSLINDAQEEISYFKDYLHKYY